MDILFLDVDYQWHVYHIHVPLFWFLILLGSFHSIVKISPTQLCLSYSFHAYICNYPSSCFSWYCDMPDTLSHLFSDVIMNKLAGNIITISSLKVNWPLSYNPGWLPVLYKACVMGQCGYVYIVALYTHASKTGNGSALNSRVLIISHMSFLKHFLGNVSRRHLSVHANKYIQQKKVTSDINLTEFIIKLPEEGVHFTKFSVESGGPARNEKMDLTGSKVL